MIATILLAVGLVLILEGLIYALAPALVEQMLRALAALPLETRRLMGLAAMATGLLLVWLGRSLGG